MLAWYELIRSDNNTFPNDILKNVRFNRLNATKSVSPRREVRWISVLARFLRQTMSLPSDPYQTSADQSPCLRLSAACHCLADNGVQRYREIKQRGHCWGRMAWLIAFWRTAWYQCMPPNRFPKSHRALSAMTESTQWWCIILPQGFLCGNVFRECSCNTLLTLSANCLMVSGLFSIKLTPSCRLRRCAQGIASSFFTWTSMASMIKPSLRFGDKTDTLSCFLPWV